MTDRKLRVDEHERRGFAVLNDMYSKVELQRETTRHAIAFVVLAAVFGFAFTYAVLIAAGVAAPGHVVAMLTGLVLGLSMWRVERRLSLFSYCDRARCFGGTSNADAARY